MMPAASSSEAPAARASRLNTRVLLVGAAVAIPLVAVLILNLGRDPHSVRSPLVGQPAPAFSLVPTGGGTAVTLDSLRGRTVVINFWATWCVPCFEEHGALAAAAQTFPGVQFLGVVYEDEVPRVLSFLEEHPSAYPSLLDPDGRAAIAYGVFGVPETFFIDRRGRIVEKFVGPLDRERIAALIASAEGGP